MTLKSQIFLLIFFKFFSTIRKLDLSLKKASFQQTGKFFNMQEKKYKIAIGNDHAGTQYKFSIMRMLREQGHEVINFGTDTDESVDYPDFIHPVAGAVEKGEVDYGIILCGSGNGAAITANKHQGVRAALCWSKELTELARQHNNANVLSLPARFISEYQALNYVQTFLTTPFEGGRHERRVKKIPWIEE